MVGQEAGRWAHHYCYMAHLWRQKWERVEREGGGNDNEDRECRERQRAREEKEKDKQLEWECMKTGRVNMKRPQQGFAFNYVFASLEAQSVSGMPRHIHPHYQNRERKRGWDEKPIITEVGFVCIRISRNLSSSELWCPLRVLMPILQQNLVLSDGVKDFCSTDQWHKNKTEICLCDSVQTQQKSLANCGQTQHAKARSQNLEMILGVSVCSPNLLSFTPDVKASMSECNTMRRH